jgi:hypothetical protein
MAHELFFEWEASDEGRAHYAAHPKQPNSQTMRMQVAFQRRGAPASNRAYDLIS